MKNILVMFGILVLFEGIPPNQTAAESISLGMVTASQYLKDNENDKVTYLIGVIDGISIEAFKSANKAETPWLAKCIESLEISQVKTVFEKRLHEKPEARNAPAALIFRDAMEKFCEKRK